MRNGGRDATLSCSLDMVRLGSGSAGGPAPAGGIERHSPRGACRLANWPCAFGLQRIDDSVPAYVPSSLAYAYRGLILRSPSGASASFGSWGTISDSRVLVSQARDALKHADPATAAGLLTEALGLWRGSPLADVSSSPRIKTEAERLERLRPASEQCDLAGVPDDHEQSGAILADLDQEPQFLGCAPGSTGASLGRSRIARVTGCYPG